MKSLNIKLFATKHEISFSLEKKPRCTCRFQQNRASGYQCTYVVLNKSICKILISSLNLNYTSNTTYIIVCKCGWHMLVVICSLPHGFIKSIFPAYCAVNANHIYTSVTSNIFLWTPTIFCNFSIL